MSDNWKYRCGWCGMPCDEDGEPMGDDAPRTTSDTVVLNGHCCPDGDGESQLRQVSREMAMDAQDMSLERQWVR